MTDQTRLEQISGMILAQYQPYDQLPEFHEGAKAYRAGNYSNPHDPNSVSAQAWDRGLEWAMRVERAKGGRLKLVRSR
jgi:hypothetical protein